MKGGHVYREGGKRAFDSAVAALALVALSPIIAVVAICIVIDDGGPVLFRQRRIGRGGAEFELLKFRSMPVGTKAVPSNLARDLKVTRVGKPIRRFSLDELPQLLNILRGDMSLVGPRPPLPEQRELIERRRAGSSLDLRPGLTGLAQIKGYEGMPVVEKAGWDEAYAKRITLRRDLSIIARTFRYLGEPPPAY